MTSRRHSKFSRNRALWLAAGALPLAAVLVMSQEPARDQAPDDFKISADVQMVALDVGVRDPKGGFVSHLPKSAFQVEEDGVPQTITAFSNQDVPVEAGLVMDDSGSMRGKRDDLNAAGAAFIEKSNPKDQMFVLNFNDTVREGLPAGMAFTDKIDLLRAALVKEKPYGKTVLYDAIATGLRHLDQGYLEKKTLVVVTDGGDNHSVIDLPALMKMIGESHATVYTVGLYDDDDPYKNPGVLRRIAAASGGECYLPKRYDEIISICEKIAADIRNRYTIGYVPMHPDKAGIRKIKVTASSPDHGKLIVQSRTSYAMPEMTASSTN